jgi:hypothetical protein
MIVHSALPEPPTAAAAEVLDATGIAHVAHGDDPMAGLPLIAPAATWAGVTRADEPGCEDDPADPCGIVLRMVARDTVVAARIAAHVREQGQRALVMAGAGERAELLRALRPERQL